MSNNIQKELYANPKRLFADRLYEQAKKLRYEGKAFSTTAKLLGISEEALYLLIR